MATGTTWTGRRRSLELRAASVFAVGLLVTAATSCGRDDDREDAAGVTAETVAEVDIADTDVGSDVEATDVAGTDATDVEGTKDEATDVAGTDGGNGRIEYQPGVYLSLIEPDACAGVLRPAMVTVTRRFAHEFAAYGYLGVVVDARDPGYEPEFYTQTFNAVRLAVHDMAIAVQWLRAHADEHCVEPNAIAATGHSFGALVALGLAYSEGEGPTEAIALDELGTTIPVEPVDIGPVPAELASYSNDLDAVVAFSGFALPDHIDTGEPPAMLFHGRNDTTIPFSLAEATCAAATAVGVTCELVPHDAGHSDAPDLRAALDQAVDFLDREMLVPAGLGELG